MSTDTDYMPPSMDDGFALFAGLCERCESVTSKNVMFAYVVTLCDPCQNRVISTKERDAESIELCAECDAIVKERTVEHHLAATHCDRCKYPIRIVQLPISTYLITTSRQRKPWVSIW